MDEEILDNYYGAKERYQEMDVEFTEAGEDIKPRGRFEDNKIMYNQATNGFKSWCTIHAWLWCVSDQTWKAFTLDQIKDVMKLAWSKYWRKDWVWMYVDDAWDCIIEWWNRNNPNDKIYKKYCSCWWELELQYMKDWFTIHTWFKGNKSYNNDVNDDCVLQWTVFGTTTYWHSIRRYLLNWKIVHIDNYYGTKKCNIYTLAQYKELLASWMMFAGWYIYTFIKPKMNERNIPYNKGKTQDEINIVTAWLQEVKNEQLRYKKYDDSYYITKMLIDLDRVR